MDTKQQTRRLGELEEKIAEAKPDRLDATPEEAVRYARFLMKRHGIDAVELEKRALRDLAMGVPMEVAERTALALWGARIINLLEDEKWSISLEDECWSPVILEDEVTRAALSCASRQFYEKLALVDGSDASSIWDAIMACEVYVHTLSGVARSLRHMAIIAEEE